MPAATVPGCPGAAPPAPPPRPGRRGRMQWLRRFCPRHRSPARRCHPVQATPNSLPCPQRPSPVQQRRHQPQWPVLPARRTTAGKPNYAHAAVRRAPGQAGSGHRQPDADSHLQGHPGPAATSRPRPVTPPRLSSRHRATSINNITPSDGEIRENARRPAVLRGLWHHRRSPLRCADQVGLARHGGQSPVRGAGFIRGRSCSTAGESGR